MAKAKIKDSGPVWRAKPKRKRPGVHAKNRNGVHKGGKHYKKPYRGQGR